MRFRCVWLAICALSLSPVWADFGYRNDMSATSGAILGKHSDIRLDKEVLIFTPVDVSLHRFFSKDGRPQLEIELEDTFARRRYDKCHLPAGVFQARVLSVYPGKKFHDTCLGEIRFLPDDDFLAWVLSSRDSQIQTSP